MNVQAAIALLQGAYSIINSGQENWICWALSDARDECGLPDPIITCHELQDYVHANLDGWEFFHTWLKAATQGKVSLNSSENLRLARLARLAWIDRMIHELETKGCLP